jgi:hypothetical protein
MCTVTYIPLQKGFLLTSSRDEARGRPAALPPAFYSGRTGPLLYPKDSLAGGAWIVLHAKGYAGVLLNGAWEPHDPQPPYRLSRGLILLELMDNPDPLTAFTNLPLENIEPFTCILADTDSLHECRWDGRKKYQRSIDANAPQIWSSVTLYGPGITARRQTWFRSWLRTHPGQDQAAILDFHRTTGDGDPQNDLLMNRDGRMLTVSITSLEFHREQGHTMIYQDTLTGLSTRRQIFPDTAIPHTA